MCTFVRGQSVVYSASAAITIPRLTRMSEILLSLMKLFLSTLHKSEDVTS